MLDVVQVVLIYKNNLRLAMQKDDDEHHFIKLQFSLGKFEYNLPIHS